MPGLSGSGWRGWRSRFGRARPAPAASTTRAARTTAAAATGHLRPRDRRRDAACPRWGELPLGATGEPSRLRARSLTRLRARHRRAEHPAGSDAESHDRRTSTPICIYLLTSATASSGRAAFAQLRARRPSARPRTTQYLHDPQLPRRRDGVLDSVSAPIDRATSRSSAAPGSAGNCRPCDGSTSATCTVDLTSASSRPPIAAPRNGSVDRQSHRLNAASAAQPGTAASSPSARALTPGTPGPTRSPSTARARLQTDSGVVTISNPAGATRRS